MSEMNRNGKLVVIDGLDGSGKTTQYELVQAELAKQGIGCKPISFPDYSQPSSALVKMYLQGQFSSDCNEVNAYAASSFYAVDRFASYKKFWEHDYQSGTLILASRYVSSNAIHQMAKLPDTQWDNYLEWLSDYEYNKLELPQPNKVIFLDMPSEVAHKLLSERYQGDESKRDIHEANAAYLIKCRNAALYAAERLGWTVVPCSDGMAPLSRDSILQAITKTVFEVL